MEVFWHWFYDLYVVQGVNQHVQREVKYYPFQVEAGSLMERDLRRGLGLEIQVILALAA